MIIIDFITILFFGLGATLSTLLDTVWFLIDYKKAEKGLEVLDHYHWALVIIISSYFILLFGSTELSVFLLGAGLMFLVQEAKQLHPFAHGSSHFVPTTVIGVALVMVLSTILLFF